MSGKITQGEEWHATSAEIASGKRFRAYGGYEGRALSERELDVLALAAEGLPNHEIGAELFVSEETVKSHMRHLLAKLGARNRAHAVTRGFQLGLLTTRRLND